MPRPQQEFDDDDIDAARKRGEQFALAKFQADEALDLSEAKAMEISEDTFPGHTERQRAAYGHEIKDAAERLYTKLKGLTS